MVMFEPKLHPAFFILVELAFGHWLQQRNDKQSPRANGRVIEAQSEMAVLLSL